MRLDLNKKNEGEWCSFNEFCGRGDGKLREFKTPIPPAEAREILVMRDFEMLLPDGRLIIYNDKNGGILKDEADGYTLDVRPEGELWIVFDKPPAFGQRVNVSGLGRKVGDAFKILPMTTVVSKKLSEKKPESLRKVSKRADILDTDLEDAGRLNFMELVVDWVGVCDGAGAPVPCNEETKKGFINETEGLFFGMFVTNRAKALRAERISRHEGDSRD